MSDLLFLPYPFFFLQGSRVERAHRAADRVHPRGLRLAGGRQEPGDGRLIPHILVDHYYGNILKVTEKVELYKRSIYIVELRALLLLPLLETVFFKFPNMLGLKRM